METSPLVEPCGWWLIDELDRAVAGPFPDQVAAALAAVTATSGHAGDDLVGSAVVRTGYGLRQPDGSWTPRARPGEQAWLRHLSDQLDRLPAQWDARLTDADPLTGLVCQIAAALLDAGLPLHDCDDQVASQPLGGVCLLPGPHQGAVLVGWALHDRLGVEASRGPAVVQSLQDTMNSAVADVLAACGLTVELLGTGSAHLVGTRRWVIRPTS